MLTRERIRACRGDLAAFDLLHALGYPVAPIEVDPDEWRRGGVPLPWNGESTLRLASRLSRFDVFVLTGALCEESVASFLGDYAEYNLLTKSVLIYQNCNSLSIFDYAGGLRRLDVDLEHPTAQTIDRLNLMAAGEDEDALPRIFDRALDREHVTRQFFQRFRAATRDVADALAEQFPDEPREAFDAEALLILSRLLFLSFIQEKGWLNGERRFLVDRLAHEIKRGREFYSTVLAPLFFGCLNRPLHERTLPARRLGRVPYLNGGLFQPSAFEERHEELRLSNELLRRVIEDVFEKFDFRIDESDAAGTHVDPEMLGRVFESLMAADERANSGSFYTPREIVDILTERAITEWLGDGGIDKLSTITVLDPACGSGAFLLSALGVIERLWRRHGEAPKDLRARIVAHSLFGVDLKPEAVRLCELRLWLAIVSASDATIETIQPLPNLDRNILQGNSLLGPTDFLGDARADLYRDWMVALRAQADLLERYRTAPHGQRPHLYRVIRGNDQRLASELLEKSIERDEHELEVLTTPQRDLFARIVPVDTDAARTLRERIDETRRMLDRVEEGTLDFFSFDVHFAHVMARGGFDVVAGNPPWVRNGRIEPRAKRMYVERYALFRVPRDGTAVTQPDLSVVFFERALSLAAPNGVIALLMPSKIANAAYAASLRRAARERARIVAIDDWSDDARRRKWFDADTFPMGIVLSRDHAQRDVRISVSNESFELSPHDLCAGDEWALVPPAVGAILRRLRRTFPPLAMALGRKAIMGVKTGDNRNFFLDVKRVKNGRVVTAEGVHIPLSAVCRCVRGRDLQRWRLERSHWMLWPPPAGWKKPPRWLLHFAEKRGLKPEAFRLSFVKPEHVGIKVAWKDLSRGMAACVLPDAVNIHGVNVPLVPNQTLYSIDAVSLDEAYAIAAVLNSTVADALLLSVAERAKDAHYRYFGRTVAAMPFVRTDRTDGTDGTDSAVARAYGVTDEELGILREFVERRLGAR